MTELASLAALVGAGAFAVLCALLFGGQRGNLIGRLLLGACIASCLWMLVTGLYYVDSTQLSIKLVFSFEILRDAAWFTFFTAILLAMDTGPFRRLVLTLAGAGFLCCVAAIFVIYGQSLDVVDGNNISLAKFGYVLFLSNSILGLLFIEQLYRNTRPEARWGIKHLCLALLGIYAYDIYLFAEGVLFSKLSAETWAARGFANALAVPLIALSAKRNAKWDINVFVSRKIVFYSAAVVCVGAYLLMVAGAGYYLKSYGGSWGGALRTALFFAGFLFLFTLLVSSQTRSRLRLFLAKHFYENKYEYGDVWLNLTEELSTHDGSAEALYSSTVKAITEILDSTGGALWYRDRNDQFVLGSNWVLSGEYPDDIDSSDPFIRALEENQQTIDLHSVAATYDSGNISVPKFVLDMPRAWLVIPIVHADALVAFMIVAESRTNDSINWEDRDLLKTVSRQIGSYIALMNTTDALTELRQFEAFNQLSAFLVHDLKNVVAQLSLVVRNSEKYRENPEFIDDSFTTISDAVNKMNRMLANLKHSHAAGQTAMTLDLAAVVENAVSRCEDGTPSATFSAASTDIQILGNEDSLISVVQHLVQNAQDATPATGEIRVEVKSLPGHAVIEISDTGAGMDAEFINNRLFKPFDTTKGKAGMGIGVYESRQLINEMGGKLAVTSEVDVGTTFTITFTNLPTEPARQDDEYPMPMANEI